MSNLEKNLSQKTNEIVSGETKKISLDDYNKQLNNFKSQNEIMKLGELRATQKHEKEQIEKIVNTELNQEDITQQNILEFLDNYSMSKNKESKLLGLLFRVNVICKDFKKSKEIISKLNYELNDVRKDLRLEKSTNIDLQEEIKESINELEDTEKEHKKSNDVFLKDQKELTTKYENLQFWLKLHKLIFIYPSIFILCMFGYFVYFENY